MVRYKVNPMLRVLFAIPMLDKGGPDRVFFELLRQLDRDVFKPMLVTSQPTGHYLARLPPDVEHYCLGEETSVATRYPVLKLGRLVRRLEPHIVLATLRMGFTAGLAKPLFPRATKLITRPANHISSNHAELIRKSPLKHRASYVINRYTLTRADHLICQGADIANDLAKLDLRVAMTTIGNPIDLAEVDRLSTPAGSLPGSPSLLAVGRLSAQKGFDLLLPAFAQLAAPTAHLTIVGTGPDEAMLKQLAASLAITDRVTFRGFVANPYPLMRAASLYVLSSRYEGFPNVALEALACGTPVVATMCPGVGELIQPGVNGWLAPVSDIAGLSRALASALASKLAPDAIRDSVRSRFDSRLIANRYEAVFDRVAGR